MTDRRTIPNPFDSDVVVDPESPSQTDVLPIHEEVFELCRNAYERVAAEHRSWSVLLYGEAGCGKTHLLSRFRKWLAGALDAKPSSPPALFVAVRMETGPGYIWRHLRRRFIEELLRRGTDKSTPLDAILSRYASGSEGSLPTAFDEAPVRDLGHDLMRVLEHYASGYQRRLCRAWLIGDAISEIDLLALNLPQPTLDGTEEDLAEYDARRMVLAITRLCAPAPVVFCFDQIEALGISQQSNSYRAFGRMGASLVDEIETGNALVVSTVLASFLKDLLNGSNQADYQRISKDHRDLQPLDWRLGKQLIEARLKLVPEAGHADPVPEAELRAFYQKESQHVTPRRLIHEARRLFARWQGEPEKPRVSVEQFISGEFERLWSQADVRTNPRTADGILSQALPLALQIIGRKTEEKPARNVDLAIGSAGGRVLIAYVNQTNMNSVAASLKKLQQHTGNGSGKSPAICVIRDERLAISKTARQARQRLQEIRQAGGRVVRVGGEALAALDAMRHLLARATSGDLSLDGDTIAPKTVRDWLAKNLPREVAGLAQEVLGEDIKEQDSPPDALLELLNRRKVMPLEEAARLTEMPPELIENYARTHPNRVGLFGGARPVVCQAVAPAAAGETRGAG